MQQDLLILGMLAAPIILAIFALFYESAKLWKVAAAALLFPLAAIVWLLSSNTISPLRAAIALLMLAVVATIILSFAQQAHQQRTAPPEPKTEEEVPRGLDRLA